MMTIVEVVFTLTGMYFSYLFLKTDNELPIYPANRLNLLAGLVTVIFTFVLAYLSKEVDVLVIQIFTLCLYIAMSILYTVRLCQTISSAYRQRMTALRKSHILSQIHSELSRMSDLEKVAFIDRALFGARRQITLNTEGADPLKDLDYAIRKEAEYRLGRQRPLAFESYYPEFTQQERV